MSYFETGVKVGQIKKSNLKPKIKKQEQVMGETKLINKGKIAVGSIFINDVGMQRRWLDLQLKFLKATTANFDHYALVFDKKSTYFDDRTNVIPCGPEGKRVRNSQAHIAGLKHVLATFKGKNQYDYFLFLDSDAFPIRINWIDLLTQRMANSFEIAVPIRFENLEQRLHASILFCKPSALSHLSFASRNIGSDLLQGSENDVTIGDYQDKRRRQAYILMRSNKFSVNPLLCGVYSDMFYHHCCGSGRNYNMRARTYWDHIAPVNTDPQKFTDELMAKPEEFVSKLAGWNPQLYPRNK